MTEEEQRSEFSSLCRFYTLTCPHGQSSSTCSQMAEEKCLTRFKKCRKYCYEKAQLDRSGSNIVETLTAALKFLTCWTLFSIQSCVHSCRPCWICSRGLRTTSGTKWTWPSSPRLCLSWWSTSTAQLSPTPERGGTWASAKVPLKLKVHDWQIILSHLLSRFMMFR